MRERALRARPRSHPVGRFAEADPCWPAPAAGVAWWLGHHVLGHPRPFFAPVAAAISLTTSRLEPSARIGQMVGGVRVGILTAEALQPAFGSTPLALAVIPLVAMVVARAIGGGFLSGSVVFINQAVGSGILVVALNRAGTE